MYSLADFSLQDMTACSIRLRRLGTGVRGMEDVADRVVRYLYEHLIDDKTRKPACALVRCFRTQTYSDLSLDRQASVQKILKSEPALPETKCLTLAGTAGERLEWNHIAHSQLYKAIPLVSAEFLTQFPMFSQLFIQLGVDLDTTVRIGSNLLRDADEHTFNVFHVPHALGSPFVPAQQDFVIPFGIKSVLGFGGLLPTGNLFAVILFSKVFLSGETADLFKPLGLSTKLALLPFDGTPVIQEGGPKGNGDALPECYVAQVAALDQLLTVHEEVVITYAAQRKRAEEALQDSEARLTAVVHSTKDVALFIDHCGVIKSWNRSAEVLFGYSAQEGHGKPCTMLLTKGSEDAFERALRVAATDPMEGTTGTTFESVGRKKDGSTFPLELSLAAWKTKRNRIILATIRDIAERKRAEAALEKSEARLRNVIDHAPDAIFTLSHDGLITSLNPAFETMTQWSRNDLVGKPFDILVHPGDLPIVRDAIDCVLHNARPFTCMLHIRPRHGEVRVGELVTTPLVEEGQIVGLLGMARDVTERKVIEEALRQSEEQLRSVMQSTQDAIVSLDHRGVVVFWNYGAEQMFGYAMEDMLNQPLTSIIPERLRERHVRGIREASDAVRLIRHRFESVGLRKDGTEFPIEFSLATWQTSSGFFFTGIIRDITQRKRAEEAIGALVQGTASVTGEEFFPVFVRHLAAAVEVSYAFVTEIVPGTTTKLRMLASWEKTTWGKTFEYETANTPCGIVLRDGKAYYARHVQHAFPDDQHLIDLAVTSYLGIAMLSSSGDIIGHVCVMDVGPLKNEQQAVDIMNVFAARAAAELERLHATAALRQSEARQGLILNSLPIAFYTANVPGDFVTTWVSDNLERLTGFASFKFLEDRRFWLTRVHPEDRERVLHDLTRARDADTVSTEYRWQTADGSYRWYLDNAVYTRDIYDNPKELIGAWIDITRRKQAEEALRESENRFKAFMDHNPALIFIKDGEGRHVYVNREFERVLQVGREGWLGKTDAELWPLEVAEQFQTNDQEVLGSNATLDVIVATVSRSGERQYWRVITFPMKDVGGNHSLGGIAVDVTGRKLAEEGHRQAEERYRSIFENAVEGIFQTTREGRYLTVNPALARIYGYASPEEMMTSVTDIGRQVYVDSFRRAEFVRLVDKHGAITGFESQMMRKDGSVIWTSESMHAMRDADGRFVGYEGTVENITARKQAEEALRESQERLTLCIQGSQAGIWDWNIGTQKVYFSPRWKQMLGYHDHEIENRFEEWEIRLHPDDHERALNTLHSYCINGQDSHYQLEHRLRHKDGSYRWMLGHGVCLRDKDGNPYRLAGSNIDITNLKKTEEQLQSALTRLRTLSGRLEVVREEERGRIARELHDEFGVGLTCLKIDLSRLKALIGNTVGMEKRPPIEDKIRSMEEFIDTTIGGVQRIVSELRPAILDDLGLVAAIEWQAQDFQRRTGIACTVHVNEEPLDIDSERATVVFRICQEALTNVARHANATIVRIRLEAQNGSAIFEVTDNGQGIAEEKIDDPHAFGLLGMRERAERFGGFVTIARGPEGGTVVTLHVRCSQPSRVVEGS
ncbi:PAS domain-containing sensor histidine kinase [Nitrospira sp. Nam74]